MNPIPDITGRMCDLYTVIERDHPQAIVMYSFSRPACIFWQAAFERLISHGMSEQRAIDWLTSKAPRCMLDQFDERIKTLAREMIEDFVQVGSDTP